MYSVFFCRFNYVCLYALPLKHSFEALLVIEKVLHTMIVKKIESFCYKFHVNFNGLWFRSVFFYILLSLELKCITNNILNKVILKMFQQVNSYVQIESFFG